jgi:hypothetical protein
MIVELILNAIASFIGLIFLWIKFRGKKSIKELRKEAEDESFAFEGAKVIIVIVGGILILGILTFLFMMSYRIFLERCKVIPPPKVISYLILKKMKYRPFSSFR